MASRPTPTRIAGLTLMALGAVGIVVLTAGGDTHCQYMTEVFAQLRLCGNEYATDVKQLRVVPVALFVSLFGAGLLIFTR